MTKERHEKKQIYSIHSENELTINGRGQWDSEHV